MAAGMKRKVSDESKQGTENTKKRTKKQNASSLNSKKLVKKSLGWKKTGPRLPAALQKEVQCLNPMTSSALNSDKGIFSDDDVGEKLYDNDVYEYEEEHPEEESRKNRRFDPVQVNESEYEMPEQLSDDFEDENLPSEDEDDDGDDVGGRRNKEAGNDKSEEEAEDGRHARMLQGITGMPSEAFQGMRTLRCINFLLLWF